MTRRHFKAPAADGAILADPPLEAWAGLVRDNRAWLAGWDHDFQGRGAVRLRALARKRVLGVADAFHLEHGLDRPAGPIDLEAPIVATGHQPELFHPGVWVKNFAVAALARSVGGVGLNLIADGDTLKKASARIPTPEGTAKVVAFDEWQGQTPQEDQAVRDEALFGGFGDAVKETLGGLIVDPLIDDFWPRARRHAADARALGLRLALARRDVEASWGARNWEARLGAVAETDAFCWFAAHVLAHLPRFRDVHNRALEKYRAENKIRSTHHPVPALRAEGDWVEAPFWVWRTSSPRRRPLFARQRDPKTVELRIGGEEAGFADLRLGPDVEACCAVETLMSLPAEGIRLRTRALTTTLYSRLFLSDLFVHGIGGAKYDELGDEVARAFLGVAPPPHSTITLTLRLGLPGEFDAPTKLAGLGRLARDLTYNPDRHLPEEVRAEYLAVVDRKRAALGGPRETRAQRVARFRAIREANAAMQPALADEWDRLEAERARLTEAARRASVAGSREYVAVLHPKDRLRAALGSAVQPLERAITP